MAILDGLIDWLERSLAKKHLDKDDGYEQLSTLTIVIPSYGRHEFILRQAVYWRYERASVIVVDGSPDPLSKSLRYILDKLPNFRYFHSNQDVFDRLNLASNYIRTPYAVLHSDDEFFLKKTLCNAISLLELNNDIVACNGQVIGFDRPSIDGTFDYTHNIYAFSNYSVLEDGLDARLTHAMSTYNAATAYAVIRSDVWKEGWAMPSWSTAHAGEIYQEIVTYLYGKLNTIDETYMLRSRENVPIDIKYIHDRSLSFEEWWQSPAFADEREDFTNKLIKVAMRCSSIKSKNARQIIENAMRTYLVHCDEKKKKIVFIAPYHTMRSFVSKLAIIFFSFVGTRKLKRLFKNRHQQRIEKAIEIVKIEKIIVEFYEALSYFDVNGQSH